MNQFSVIVLEKSEDYVLDARDREVQNCIMPKKKRQKGGGGSAHDRAVANAMPEQVPESPPPLVSEPSLDKDEGMPQSQRNLYRRITKPKDRLWSSSPFWGTLGIVVTLLATYFGFALGDLRWFLVAAWPFLILILVLWELSIRITPPTLAARFWGTLVDIVLSGMALYILSVQIPPPIQTKPSEGVTANSAPQFDSLKRQLQELGNKIDSRSTAPKPKPSSGPPTIIASVGNLGNELLKLSREIATFDTSGQESCKQTRWHDLTPEDEHRHYLICVADISKGYRYLYKPRVIAIRDQCAQLNYRNSGLDQILKDEESQSEHSLPAQMMGTAQALADLAHDIKQL